MKRSKLFSAVKLAALAWIGGVGALCATLLTISFFSTYPQYLPYLFGVGIIALFCLTVYSYYTDD